MSRNPAPTPLLDTSPTPRAQVGLAVNKLPLDWRRLHYYLGSCALMETFVLIPIAAALIANT